MLQVSYYHNQLEFLGADFDNHTHLPATWIVIATAIAVVGLGMVWISRRFHPAAPSIS